MSPAPRFSRSSALLLALAATLATSACRDDRLMAPLAPRANAGAPSRNVVEGSATILGSLGGDPGTTEAMAINDAGQVTGLAQLADYVHLVTAHAFLWEAGQMRDLGALGGRTSRGTALNASGMVAGYSTLPDNQTEHAFRWTPAAGMQDLGTLGGRSEAWSINASGQVAGFSDVNAYATHAFLWTPGSGMRDLGTLGGAYSYAFGVNDAGMVVGSSSTAANEDHAFLWTATDGMRDLGALAPGIRQSIAQAINNSGQVVGFGDDGNGYNHAFLWTATNGMRDLGTLGGSESQAVGINDLGDIVGWSTDAANQSHGFVWSQTGGMESLTQSGLFIAVGINDHLQVLGNSTLSANVTFRDRATIVPITFASPDHTPPVIAPTVTGTLGSNGWYTSDVAVAWSVVDGESAISSESGCAAASITTDTPGLTLACSATSAGGTGSRSVTVMRDGTPPVVTYAANAGTYTVDQTIAITCSASDAMSGLASTTCVDLAGPAYTFTLGLNAFHASATDRAGNTGTGSVAFTVQATSGSVCTLTRRFVSKAGVANALCEKLDAAAASARRGDAQAEAGQLGAFANQLAAQVGKSVTAADAAVLQRLASSM